MKKIFCFLLTVALLIALVGCSADTYTIESQSDTFKPKTVTSITLEGPSNTDVSGVSIVLDKTMHTTDFNRLIALIQGKKTSECPAGIGIFLPGKITFTFESGKTTTVYPANDGSGYISLYSINPSLAQYIEIPKEDMAEVIQILEKHGIAAKI